MVRKAYDYVMKRKLTGAWLMTIGALLTFLAIGEAAFVTQQVGVLAWKVLLVSVAVKLAHVLRKQLFHYVDLSEMARTDNPNFGRAMVAMSIFYSAVILAIAAAL